jgi:hypothetical protein
VVIPWIVQRPRYLPGFLRLARTLKQSHRVRALGLTPRRKTLEWRAL